MIILKYADPAIPWPDRAEEALCPREGWTAGRISLFSVSGVTVDAMCRGDLAVHRMLEDVGFTITIAALGYRLSFGGRVFAASGQAMGVAEQMMAMCDDWSRVPARNAFTTAQIACLEQTHIAAERAGHILKNVVFPR